MKHYQLPALTFVCMLIIMASCNMKPHPPEAMKLPGNENSTRAYIKAENDYSEKWLDQFSSLRKTVGAELTSREYTVPPEQTVSNDTTVKAGGIWKLIVKGGKEVHALSTGNPKAGERVIYTENDPGFSVSLRTSSSKNYIFIESTSGQSSEVRFLSVLSKSLNPVLIQDRKPGIFYQADHFGGNMLWVLSNENAPMRCILLAPAQAPYSAKWKAAVRENDSVFIDSYTVINLQYLVLVQRKHLGTSIEITSIYPDKKKESSVENRINFPEPEGRISDLLYDRKEDKLVFRYSSIITPPTCYTYGLHSMHLGIRWKKQIKGFIRDDYKAEVIRAISKDNSRIPVSVIRKMDPERQDAARPLLLFIESGKECEHCSSFRSDLLSLLDRGFSIAFLHIPDRISADHGDREMIMATVSALISGKYTTEGLISLAGRNREALAAFRAATENPLRYRALIMDSPEFSDFEQNLNVPFIYLYADPGSHDRGFGSLKLGSAIRKITKPGNTLLVSTGSEGSLQPGMSAGLITFLLSSYGIEK